MLEQGVLLNDSADCPLEDCELDKPLLKLDSERTLLRDETTEEDTETDSEAEQAEESVEEADD